MVGRQGMDTLTGELADIREKLIPKMPDILIGFYISAEGIKGFLGQFLVLWGYAPIVDEGLESLSIIALKHHLLLLLACTLSLIGIDVKGFQVV